MFVENSKIVEKKCVIRVRRIEQTLFNEPGVEEFFYSWDILIIWGLRLAQDVSWFSTVPGVRRRLKVILHFVVVSQKAMCYVVKQQEKNKWSLAGSNC